MGHIHVLFREIPACMQEEFGCSENMKRVLQAHLEAGDYTKLAKALDAMDVDIWLPSYLELVNIDAGNGVLLCKKGDTTGRISDGKLWASKAKPAHGEDPRVCADNCTRADGNKECWFWIQGGDPECIRIKCKSLKVN